MDNYFIEKITSRFPLSIGTSLAFESMFEGPLPAYDETRVIPNKINTNDYNIIYINIYTVLRNLLSSIKEKTKIINNSLIVENVISEMEIIEQIVKTNSNLKLCFYLNDFTNIDKNYTLGIFRDEIKNTGNSIKSTLEYNLKTYLKNNNNIKVFKNELNTNVKENALVITSYTIDLLNYKKFNKLSLLESNTGVLKNSNLFYTKMYNGKDLLSIPFNKIFLQVFGDNSIFKPYPIKIRKEILEISEKQNWNQLTTTDRIKLSIEMLGSPELKNIKFYS